MNRFLSLVFIISTCLLTGLCAQPDTSERVRWETTHSVIQDPSGIRQQREDSVLYFYSGIRNSVYDYNRLCYHCPPELGTLDPDYRFISPEPANIDPQLRPNVQYDSFYRRGPEGSGNFPEKWTQVIRYNASNTPAEIVRYAFVDGNPDTQATNRVQLSWNGFRLTHVDYLFRSPGWVTPSTASVRFIRYSSAGKIILDSLATNYYTYGYDGKGRCNMRRSFEQSGWSYLQTGYDSMIYDAADRVVWHFHRQRNLTSFPDSYNDSFGYTANVPGYTYRQRQYADASGQLIANFSVRIATRLNALNRIDSITSYYGAGPADRMIDGSVRLEYDTSGNPIRKTEWFMTSPVPSSVSVYGYESYIIPDTTTPVPTRVSPLANSFTLSPNPTTGALRVQNGGARSDERFFLTITDPVGRLIQQEAFRMPSGTRRIELGAGVVPGIYLIRIADGRGAAVYSGRFERR